MSWITPKTNWVKTDFINYTDYNRWKNNVEYIKDLLVVDTASVSITVTEGYRVTMMPTVSDLQEGDVATFIYRFVSSDEETVEEKIFSYTENGHYDEGLYICPESGTMYFEYYDTRGCGYFPYEDMGNDKLLNAYWRAAEMNRICDNLDSMCEALGVDFSGKPMYSDNGATPTYTELNLIEKRTRDLYNQIMGVYTMYLGIGYTGSRISNILL